MVLGISQGSAETRHTWTTTLLHICS